MKVSAKILIIVFLLALLGLAIGCSPASVDSSSSGGGLPAPPTTSSTPSAIVVTAGSTALGVGTSTNITAYVVDNIGHPVANATVIFSLDSGLKGSLTAATAVTDSAGNAIVTFTAGSTASTVIVTGSIGSINASVSIVIGGGGGGTVSVTASQSSIVSGSTSTIIATVKDGTGAPVSNASVNFNVNNNMLASLSPYSTLTNSNGMATTVLTGTNTGTNAASVTITATVTSLGGINGQTNVTINPVATVPTLNISTTSSSILTYATTTINVSLTGFGANPVDNQTISFFPDNPSAAILSAPSVTTDVNGLASITLTAKGTVTTVKVTASFAGPPTPLSAFTTVSIIAAPPDSVVLTANPTSITVYGTTTISALVTGNSTSVPDGTPVSFLLSDSTFGSLSNSNGSTVNGKATTTFIAAGKAGSPQITAVAGTVSSSPETITISPAATGSIQFVSAVPQVIGIQGSGSTEQSLVTFSVLDVNGNPVADGTQVAFSMLGPGGGAYIGSIPGATTATAGTVNGNASVYLHSGTTAGPVTIIASTSVTGGGTISSSASQISIGGGVPSATHFSLATTQFNLPGLVVSNKQATISAYVADRFGNYNVLNGTSVSFYTEAGAIDRSGVTDSTGKTAVVFRTQAPNPSQVAIWDAANAPYDETALINYLNSAATYSAGIPLGNAIHPRNGWTSVLATVQGEESFLDENGDGLFTRSISTTSPCPPGHTCECDNGTPNTYAGCITSQANGFLGGTDHCVAVAPLTGTPATCAAVLAGSARSEGFIDIGEPFIDVNDDGCWNSSSYKSCGGVTSASSDPFELYVDTPPYNGAYDPPNGKWDGQGCKTTGCQTSKMIWTRITLAFTGNAQYCEFSPKNFIGNIPYGSYASFSFMVGDVFTNALIPGTAVSVGITGGGSLAGQTSYRAPDGVPFGPTEISFTVIAPPACTCTPTPPATSCTCVNPPPSPFTVTGTATSDVVGCIANLSGEFGP